MLRLQNEIYNMLRDYKGNVTIKIDGLAASAASVIAMAGNTVLVSPVAMMMIHNPATLAIGNAQDMERAIAMLNEVKESILNAYEGEDRAFRARLSHMMDDETWFNAKKRWSLDSLTESCLIPAMRRANLRKKPEEEEEKEEDGGEEEEKKKFPFQQDSVMFSRKAMNDSFLSRFRIRNRWYLLTS